MPPPVCARRCARVLGSQGLACARLRASAARTRPLQTLAQGSRGGGRAAELPEAFTEMGVAPPPAYEQGPVPASMFETLSETRRPPSALGAPGSPSQVTNQGSL